MNIDLKALREVAEKATPGPWICSESSTGEVTIDALRSESVGEVVLRVPWRKEPVDTWFVATFNPAMVLALLDRLEAAEAVSARVKDSTFLEGVLVRWVGFPQEDFRAAATAQVQKALLGEEKL